ncbi:hypothetical protein ACKFKG_32835 [Phormidesmis sp. 146-35]
MAAKRSNFLYFSNILLDVTTIAPAFIAQSTTKSSPASGEVGRQEK